MTLTYILQLYVFILAGFVGYNIITRVPPLLHTPLMSATNAISAISIVGALVVAGSGYSRLAGVLGMIAVACATINVVGGFIITDRMLRMFKRASPPRRRRRRAARTPAGPPPLGAARAARAATAVDRARC
jgi:NAD(P) transhydrogenase subunit alpha